MSSDFLRLHLRGEPKVKVSTDEKAYFRPLTGWRRIVTFGKKRRERIMARGNWRNWEGRNGAEKHGARKEIDGYNLKKSGSFDSENEASNSAEMLRMNGYIAHVTKGRTKWTVWRSFQRHQKKMI